MFQVLLCNFHLVIPVEVKDIQFFRNDNRNGCNGTRRVRWLKIDTGNCLVNYTIQFKDNDGIRSNVSGIRGSYFCTSKYDNATSVIVWATFENRQGTPSQETQLSKTTPKPTNPSTGTSAASSTEKGIKLF